MLACLSISLIDPHELGNTFYDLPIEDDQLKKHSKKVRVSEK